MAQRPLNGFLVAVINFSILIIRDSKSIICYLDSLNNGVTVTRNFDFLRFYLHFSVR